MHVFVCDDLSFEGTCFSHVCVCEREREKERVCVRE